MTCAWPGPLQPPSSSASPLRPPFGAPRFFIPFSKPLQGKDTRMPGHFTLRKGPKPEPSVHGEWGQAFEAWDCASAPGSITPCPPAHGSPRIGLGIQQHCTHRYPGSDHVKDQAGKKRQARRLPQGCCVPNSAQSVSSCPISSGWAPRASGRQPRLLAGPSASAQVVSAPILGDRGEPAS